MVGVRDATRRTECRTPHPRGVRRRAHVGEAVEVGDGGDGGAVLAGDAPQRVPAADLVVRRRRGERQQRPPHPPPVLRAPPPRPAPAAGRRGGAAGAALDGVGGPDGVGPQLLLRPARAPGRPAPERPHHASRSVTAKFVIGLTLNVSLANDQRREWLGGRAGGAWEPPPSGPPPPDPARPPRGGEGAVFVLFFSLLQRQRAGRGGRGEAVGVMD